MDIIIIIPRHVASEATETQLNWLKCQQVQQGYIMIISVISERTLKNFCFYGHHIEFDQGLTI